ncbi:AI-2E family transporter [Clostridiaceae bacterium M8S5]|nr:AI-2E family transporter [Clostridiaceae bacterium M8S5]
MDKQEQILNERKKFFKIILLIAFGVLFYMFVSDKEYIQWAYSIVKPLLHAFIIAYLLNPLVKLITKHLKLSKHLSIILLILLLLAFIFFMFYVVIPNLASNVISLINNFPDIDSITSSIDNFFDKYVDDRITEMIRKNSNNIIAMSIEKGKTILTDFLQGFINKTLYFTTSIINLLISLIIAIYMILDKDDLCARLKRLIYAFFRKSAADYIFEIGNKSNDAFISYFTGKLLDSSIIGLLSLIFFTIAGVPYGSVLALIIGITNMIEYFGPFIGAIPAIIITLFTDLPKTIWVGIIILALQQFDGLFLGPKIIGKKVGLRAFWVVIAVIIGGSLFGVSGMILGVPSTVLIKNLVEEAVDKRLKVKGLAKLEVDKLKK